MALHYITWYNVENLFDVQHSPARPAWLAENLHRELKGWTPQVLDRKIGNLTAAIRQVNDGKGPDLLGVCEVENLPVLERLCGSLALATGRPYACIHKHSSDQRGIDIAFIYDTSRYTADPDLVFSLEVMKRNATRDMVQITVTTEAGNELILIGNHWPSRSGGKYESEPYRCMVGETLSYWVNRIHTIKGDQQPVLVFGDFNDEPHNRSLTEYALSTRSRNKVIRARSKPWLYNLMWDLMDEKDASYIYGGQPEMIDQFLANKGLILKSSPFRIEGVRLECFPGMTYGLYNTPRQYGRPSSKSTYYPDGFSDHLPVSCILRE